MRVQLPFLAGAVFLAAACSDHTDPNPVDDGPPPAEVTVNVRDDLFVNAAVRVLEGGTVTWVWQGDNLHNVTFNGGPASGNQAEGWLPLELANGTSIDVLTLRGKRPGAVSIWVAALRRAELDARGVPARSGT